MFFVLAENILLNYLFRQKFQNSLLDTGGPVQILGSQGIVLLRNRTKRGLVLST